MNQNDPYFKLRVQPPTPEGEQCHCQPVRPLKLMYALTNNPIHCVDCNLEVSPDDLNFPSELVEAVIPWRTVYGALYQLWLDSGAYEAWAQQELTDIRSAVNLHGLTVRATVGQVRTCYYWYFQDQAMVGYRPMQTCPNCSRAFTRYDKSIFVQHICEHCYLITVGQ